MSIRMDAWREIAGANVGRRPGAPGRLSGKVALITGAAQGLGWGIAQRMHEEGACVALADRNGEAVREAAKFLGDRALGITADVTCEESVARMVGQAVDYFHGLDVLVANAGVVRSGSILQMEKEDFDFVTGVNYTGYYLCAKYAALVMQAQHEADPAWMGDIIAINSKSGLVGSNKNFAYAGSKFGGIGLTQSLALELCVMNIKVNAVCPGNYLDGPLWSDPDTGLFTQYLKAGKVPGAKTAADVKAFYEQKVPMGRGCLPEDVFRAVLYCVEQRYETGQAIPVTGGQCMLG